jgi:predicted RNA-binding Zn ribbon-like protein
MTAIEHVGNALCLDFANTVNVRSAPDRDWLSTAAGLQVWATSAGYPVTPDDGPDASLERMRTVRDAVYRIFSPIAHGEPSDTAALRVVTATHAEGVQRGHLERANGVYTWSWPSPRTRVVLLWEVAASTVELLGQGPLNRIGECPSCGWAFLDTSKNGRRRWCSMATCGSRDKAQRYYARHSGEFDEA